MDKSARVTLGALLGVWLATLIALATLFRYQLVPAGIAASSGGDYDAAETKAAAYRLDRWTGRVVFYEGDYGIRTHIKGDSKR